jgi:hypothetical protein
MVATPPAPTTAPAHSTASQFSGRRWRTARSSMNAPSTARTKSTGMVTGMLDDQLTPS